MSSFSVFSRSILPNHHFKFNAYYLVLMISWRCQLHLRSESFLTFPASCVRVCERKMLMTRSQRILRLLFRTKINKNWMPRGAERRKKRCGCWWYWFAWFFQAKNSLLSCCRQCQHCLLLWYDFVGKLDSWNLIIAEGIKSFKIVF